MKKGRRVLAVVVALCVVMGAMICPGGMKRVQAEDFVYEDYQYSILGDETVSITKYTGTDTKLDIPGEIEGRRVSSIGEHAFSGCNGLTKIRIPNEVTSIGSAAFSGCSGLVEIQIPDGVSGIGNWTFSHCTGLTEIRIPDGVSSIGGWAFLGCSGLTKIRIPDGVSSIGENAFSECSSLTEIRIPDGVSMGYAVFADCSGLTKVRLPDGVTSIGDGTFGGCSGLTEIHIPDEVTSIGDLTFFGCSGLTEIHIPDEVTSIGQQAFTGCSGLTEICIPDKVTSIGLAAFSGCSGLVEIQIPDGVSSIGDSAFYNCSALTEIRIPDGVTSIRSETLKNCTSLINIELPEEITNIGKEAFSGCTDLTDINIPQNVSSIAEAAFKQCSSLTNVYYSGTEAQWNQITIGEDNDELLNAEIYCEGEPIGDYKYRKLRDGTIEITEYTGSDAEVVIPDIIDGRRVTSIGSDAFLNNDRLIEITISAGITSLRTIEEAGSRTGFLRNCPNLKAIYVDEGNENFFADQGILFNKKKTELIRYPQGKQGEYIIPSSVRWIANGAFCACKNLTKITIPSEVNSIGYAAFSECERLSEIKIPSDIVQIEDFAFNGCNNLGEMIIPSGVTSIGICSFAECRNLVSITIPASLKEIESEAFHNCSSLRDVYYSGIKSQWDEISIDNDGNMNAEIINAIIHFSDGTVLNGPQEEESQKPDILNTRQELDKLKNGDFLLIEQDFQHYLSEEQIDIIESCLYTWLAEINYAYKYSGSNGVKERIMKKAGIDPEGDFTSGEQQAVTHISVGTTYGTKTFEITLNLGKPDSGGNLYPAYGAMQYEILEKDNIPSDLPKTGQIGKTSYTDMGTFVECVSKSADDSLHSTFQWESLSDEMTAGILSDKTVTEIIGNKNGSFSEGTFIVYAKPLFTYSKIVKIACPVDVRVYSMDGKEAGSIIGNKPNGGSQNVRLDLEGDTKRVFLTGNDYYLNLQGTGTGTMQYTVEEVANEEVKRSVQFLEVKLKEDLQYEGYVFRPLNIDSDLYALRTVGSSGQEVIYPDEDKHNETLSVFKRIQGLSLSQQKTTLDADKTVQLSASLSPLDASNPNLRWTIDDESVARVDSRGLVTAVGAGSTIVTVATKDGSFLKQFCVIDVAEKKGSNGGTGSSSGSSSGWSGGGVPVVEQEKNPVVANLHYVLQFQTNGGTGLSRRTMTLLADDSPGIMPKVKRKDYTFNGWYTQQEGGTKITGDKPLKEAATLYAQWTKTAAPAKPAAPTLKSKKKGQVQVGFKSVNGAAGYQIEYSADKKFSSVKTKEVGTSAKLKTISGLKAGKKYYVRIRAYNVDSMKNRIYGLYSMVKNVKVKNKE